MNCENCGHYNEREPNQPCADCAYDCCDECVFQCEACDALVCPSCWLDHPCNERD